MPKIKSIISSVMERILSSAGPVIHLNKFYQNNGSLLCMNWKTDYR